MVILGAVPRNKSNKRTPAEHYATNLETAAVEIVCPGLDVCEKKLIVIGDRCKLPSPRIPSQSLVVARGGVDVCCLVVCDMARATPREGHGNRLVRFCQRHLFMRWLCRMVSWHNVVAWLDDYILSWYICRLPNVAALGSPM